MLRAVSLLVLASLALAFGGCGGDEGEQATVGFDTNGESITKPKDEALESYFDAGGPFAYIERSVCESIKKRSEADARALFEKNFNADIDFTADEVFDSAADRC